ncbi:MAG: hypothetical protein KME17_18060 [Cyanosarcina radialis HA8281-LM2]|jgi:hypothetical protein|nr:hypothetical protein [Cyanosarcina radialis HA8281-LM2]
MDRDDSLQPVESVDRSSEETKKPWITPQVSESPIVELTLGGRNPNEVDGGFYS